MTDIDKTDCVVVGAGVVGLAVAREVARAGREVIVLERHNAFGTETSARNSEVIHAGIYYAHDSLKARLCVEGRHLLYQYLESHGLDYRRCGKLIVAASDEQASRLDAIAARARANGVDDLSEMTGDAARALEPALSPACAAALISPSTGIVDSHGLMLSYAGEIADHGGAIACEAPFQRAERRGDGFRVHVGGTAPMALDCRWLINSAGLSATGVARRIEGLDPAHVPEPLFAKGNYFTLAGRAPFTRLIYPVPEPGGLGVHLTLDLGGQAKFGPDVEWIDAPDYDVDPARGERFYAAVRRYWPGLADGALQAGYAGVRPKLKLAPGAEEDFVLQGPESHGLAGLVNLYGIESPGLTSSLALARAVTALLSQNM